MHSICAEIEATHQEKDSPLKNIGGRRGVVAALYIGPKRKEPMLSVAEVRAIAGTDRKSVV